MCTATPAARAYAPEATAVVAERMVMTLPLKARTTLAGPELSLALASLADRAERDPEAFETARQVALVPAAEGVSASEVGAVVDRALVEFQDARLALRQAWQRADRMAAAEAIARLAQSAADLADPYRSVPADAAEPEGARAWLGDAFDRAALATVTAAASSSDDPATLVAVAAEQRPAIDAAVEAQDEASITALRSGLLSRASALVAAVARAEWHPEATAAPAFRLAPEPLQGRVTLYTELAAPAAARLELFDIAGRRLRTHELGVLPAGATSVTVPASWSAGLPSGIYMARLSAGAMRNERRVTRIAE